MALTGLDYYLSIPQPAFDPSFVVMERNSIDLNKHAFDLNEVPANDPSIPETSSSQGNVSGWVPKKGGWLELFCNMFAPENCVIGKAQLSCNPLPWNPDNNINPQLDQRIQGDVKMFHTPYLNNISGIDGYQDRYRHNDGGCVTFPSLSELRRSNGTWEPPPLNTGSIFNVPILPVHDPMTASPNAGKPNGGARPKVRHPLYRGARPPRVANHMLQNPTQRAAEDPEFVHSTSQLPVHDSGHSKQVPRGLDLNTSPDSETGCQQAEAAGFPSSLCPVYNHGLYLKETKTQVVRSDKEQAVSPQPFVEEFQTKLVKSENNLGQKPSNFKNLPSTSNDSKKDSEPRVRIIASPDWLPPGWITELKTRKAGSTAGCTDKYYKDPVTGHRFRSKNEVMSFLQTGQTCRYKNQGKNNEALPFIKPMPGLPMPELGTGSFSFLLPVEHNYLPPPNGSTHYCTTSADNILSERIIVKQEPNEISQATLTEHSDHQLPAFPFLVEGSHNFGLQSIAPPDHLCKEKCDFSVQCNNKRKFVNNMSDELLLKRPCFGLELNAPQGELSSSSLPNAMKEEIATNFRAMHGRYHGPLFNMGQNSHNIGKNGPQDKRMYQSLLTRYMPNESAHSSMLKKLTCNVSKFKSGHIKETIAPKGHPTRCSEKKVPKLTLKQERELLVTLGRKLCQEFLTSAKKLNEPHIINNISRECE